MEGKTFPMSLQLVRIKGHTSAFRAAAEVGEVIAMRIEGETVAGVVQSITVLAHPVDADHAGQVLYGPRLQQAAPVLAAGVRPVGDVQRQVVIPLVATEHGKTQVVA